MSPPQSSPELHCSGPSATTEAGLCLGKLLQPGDLIGLIGDLGAGKTLLTQAIARGLQLPETVRVTSPTFALINVYHGGRMPLYHADLYRLENEAELDELGLDEICRQEDGVVVIEWSDRFPVFPAEHLQVQIDIVDDQRRIMRPSGNGLRSTRLALSWAQAVAGP